MKRHTWFWGALLLSAWSLSARAETAPNQLTEAERAAARAALAALSGQV